MHLTCTGKGVVEVGGEKRKKIKQCECSFIQCYPSWLWTCGSAQGWKCDDSGMEDDLSLENPILSEFFLFNLPGRTFHQSYGIGRTWAWCNWLAVLPAVCTELVQEIERQSLGITLFPDSAMPDFPMFTNTFRDLVHIFHGFSKLDLKIYKQIKILKSPLPLNWE